MARLIYSNPVYGGTMKKKDYYDYDISSNNYNIIDQKVFEKKDIKRMQFEYLDSYVNEVRQEISRDQLKGRLLDAAENLGQEINTNLYRMDLNYENRRMDNRQLKTILSNVINQNYRKENSTQTTESDTFNLLEKKRKTDLGDITLREFGIFPKEKDTRGDDTYKNTWINTSSRTTSPRTNRRNTESSIPTFDNKIQPKNMIFAGSPNKKQTKFTPGPRGYELEGQGKTIFSYERSPDTSPTKSSPIKKDMGAIGVFKRVKEEASTSKRRGGRARVVVDDE